MGMPCEINSILKLSPSQGYPAQLEINTVYEVSKEGYRILPIDVPISLVDSDWIAYADVEIVRLTWQAKQTTISFRIARIYSSPIVMKD